MNLFNSELQAKFPIIHGYHFGGGRLLYYGRQKPRTPHQYGKAQRGPLAIHATGYYSGTSSRAATSHAYRMSTHPPIPAKQQRLLRPLSRRHFQPTSTYRPGNILAPLSKQKSTYYQVSLLQPFKIFMFIEHSQHNQRMMLLLAGRMDNPTTWTLYQILSILEGRLYTRQPTCKSKLPAFLPLTDIKISIICTELVTTILFTLMNK